MESDARGIKDDDSGGGGARCGWCDKPIRSSGGGQKPGYCKGRSCSSKAARRRVKERQEATLAAVLDNSREPSSPLKTATAEQLARQGRIVERTAHRLAADLDRGADPMHLRVSLAAVTRAAEDLLAQARTAVQRPQAGGQHGRQDDHLDVSREPLAAGVAMPQQRAQAPAPQPQPTTPEPTPAQPPMAFGPVRPDASRVPARDVGSTELHDARGASAPTLEALAHVDPTPPPATPDALRPGLAEAAAEAEAEAMVPPLALGPASNWIPLTDRLLGVPRRDYALGDGLVHLTWPSAPGVQALEQRGQLVGWTEVYDDSGAWIALIDGRPVSGADDLLPLLSIDAPHAIILLRLALRRGVA